MKETGGFLFVPVRELQSLENQLDLQGRDGAVKVDAVWTKMDFISERRNWWRQQRSSGRCTLLVGDKLLDRILTVYCLDHPVAKLSKDLDR